MKNNKKIIFIISIIISFFGVLSVMLGIYAQKKDTYIFYTDKLSDDIFINEIRIGDSLVKLTDFDTDINKYDSIQSKIRLSNTENYIIEISKIDNLKISFDNSSNKDCNVLIKKNNKKIKNIKINSVSNYVFMDNIGTFSIIINIIQNLSFGELFLVAILYFIFLLVVYLSLLYILKFFNNLISDNFKVKNYIVSFILLFIINLMYIFLFMQIYKFLALIPMLFAIILIFIIFSKNKVNKLQNYYISISMFIGILFLLVLPPLHVPDEFSHFIKAYQTSFIFQDNNEIKMDATYVYLPDNFKNFIIKYDSQTLNYYFKMNSRTYFDDLLKVTDYKNLSKKITWYSLKNNNSVPYLLGTFMSIVAKITKMPIILLYYLSKICCLIISSLMCYYAIKIVPKFKKIFFIVPLLPIFIQQSCGINVDWLTNCTFILLLAFIIKSIYNEIEISSIDKKIMIFLAIVLGFCKFGYFPIALLFLLIPKSNLKKNYFKYLIIIIIISIPILIFFGNKLMISNNTVSSAHRNLIPFSTIITDPVMILNILIKTFAIRLDLDLFRGLITGFGWSTIWVNDLFLFISMILFMGVILCHDKDNIKLSKKQKIVIFTSFILMCGIIYAAMLFQWSEIGSDIIDGLQPRYFIPPIMLLYILLQNKHVTINFKNQYLYYSISLIIINILALITIVEKIYV